MLIDFAVENYRSIKDPVTLSFVAAGPPKGVKPSRRKRPIVQDSEIARPFDLAPFGIQVLPAIGIFGANASGKSNVVRALGNLRDFLVHGWGPHVPEFLPFRLDSATAALPSRFRLRVALPQPGEVTLVAQYDIELTGNVIVREVLSVVRPDREQLAPVFTRAVDVAGASSVSFGSYIPQSWSQMADNLAAHASLLGAAFQMLKVPLITALYHWFLSLTGTYSPNDDWPKFATEYAMQRVPGFLAASTNLVRRFDTQIDGLRSERAGERGPTRIFAKHHVGGTDVEWPLAEESAGTQRLVDFSGPILGVLGTGGLLVLDEFGAHLHPAITHRIVRLFQNPKTNPKHAQLLFNSHDMTLLAGKLLRRDQIWFTQKRPDRTTELIALQEYKPRNDLAIELAYLDGRFGAVPFLPDEEEMVTSTTDAEQAPKQ